MAESAAQRADAVKTASEATRGLDAAAQVAAVEGVVPPPDATTAGVIWRMAVGGILVLLAIALLGMLYLLADDKKPDLALTAFSALLTGFLAWFAPSPVKKAGDGS
jgi:hypothetical protein